MKHEANARFSTDLLEEIRRLRDQIVPAVQSQQTQTQTLPVKPLILVVDDDQDSVFALTMLLDSEGFDVQTAANGVEALACIARNPPRLVLTDVKMPEMDGNELCRRLAQDASTSGIPVFVITGYEQASTEATAHAREVFRKPIDTERVISLIRTRTASTAT